MRSVAIVLFPYVQSLDVAGPLDVFAKAKRFVAEDDGYQISTIGAVRNNGPICSRTRGSRRIVSTCATAR